MIRNLSDKISRSPEKSGIKPQEEIGQPSIKQSYESLVTQNKQLKQELQYLKTKFINTYAKQNGHENIVNIDKQDGIKIFVK